MTTRIEARSNLQTKLMMISDMMMVLLTIHEMKKTIRKTRKIRTMKELVEMKMTRTMICINNQTFITEIHQIVMTNIYPKGMTLRTTMISAHHHVTKLMN